MMIAMYSLRLKIGHDALGCRMSQNQTARLPSTSSKARHVERVDTLVQQSTLFLMLEYGKTMPWFVVVFFLLLMLAISMTSCSLKALL